MNLCKRCQKEIPATSKSAVSEVARRKGYCNHVCWERAEPISMADVDSVLSRTDRERKDPETEAKCFCGICLKSFKSKLPSETYKRMIRAPGGMSETGELNLACPGCRVTS